MRTSRQPEASPRVASLPASSVRLIGLVQRLQALADADARLVTLLNGGPMVQKPSDETAPARRLPQR